MNQEEKKELMGKYAKKLENAIKREAAVIKEMENDKALIKCKHSISNFCLPFPNGK